MKVVILAGGLGTRISEETDIRPKPMIEIGGKPILWHIMKIYESHGFNDFIICLGYKGYVIKEYFMNYFMHNSDVTIDLENNSVKVLQTNSESFKVTLVDTGLNTKTAGRLKRIQHHINNERFMLTYGDGVANIDLKELLKFHIEKKRAVTVTSIQPGGKFGSLDINESSTVSKFIEKPKGDGHWINGGFFVLEPEVFNYLKEDSDNVMWEDEPLEKLAIDGQLAAFKHNGFWKCMDAVRDRIELEELWKGGKAKWKIWQ
ncbi:MAG: glucose-1-phosphate cytidylyltransferase [Bacteroidota bacterium]